MAGLNRSFSSISTESGGIKEQSSRVLWASEFDGADADARLDNALAAASNGQTIKLERETYGTDRTISKPVVLDGASPNKTSGGTVLGAEFTLSARVVVESILDGNGAATFDVLSDDVVIKNCHGFGGAISINGDDVLIWGLNNLSVTFAAGTTGGLVDTSTNVSVTDNGTNTVGDIA